MKIMNKIKVDGKFIAIRRNKRFGFWELTLMAKTTKKDDPFAYLHFALKEPLSPDFTLNDYISVTGHVRGYRYKETNKYMIHQYFIADSVRHAITDLEKITGYKGHFFEMSKSCNYFAIGKISSVIPCGNNWNKIYINITEEGQNPNIICVDYPPSQKLPEADTFKKGAYVAVECRITTQQKEIHGNTNHFENFRVADIAVIK